MSQSLTRFLKPALVLGPLVALSFLAPSHPIDPWGIASPQKIARLILALSIVQIMSSFISGLKFRHVGVVITGFLGGLVSSTATTVALARRSKEAKHEKPQLALVSLLSSTNAMLAEALLLALVGLTDFPLKLLWVILPPAGVTVLAIFFASRKAGVVHTSPGKKGVKWGQILKLTALIVGLLALSKLLQTLIGKNALMVLTFVASLFELHGSVIANIELHERGALDENLLATLLFVSLEASFLSKAALVWIMGSKPLKNLVLKATAVLILSTAIGWAMISSSF